MPGHDFFMKSKSDQVSKPLKTHFGAKNLPEPSKTWISPPGEQEELEAATAAAGRAGEPERQNEFWGVLRLGQTWIS